MTSANRTVLKYFLVSQLIVFMLIALYFVFGGTLAGLQVVWSMKELVFGFIALEVYAGLSVFILSKESRVIRDEREQLIELKSYRATYKIVSLVIGAILLYNLILVDDIKPSMPLVLLIVFLTIVNFLSMQFYRKRI